MKLAGGLLALAVVATVVAFVLALSRSKDDLPGDLRGCVKDGGADVVKGAANLGGARREIDAGTLRRVRRIHNGDDTVLVFAGQRFRLLVLANASSPSVAGDLPRRVYERADEYALVALESDPVKGVLTTCAGRAVK